MAHIKMTQSVALMRFGFARPCLSKTYHKLILTVLTRIPTHDYKEMEKGIEELAFFRYEAWNFFGNEGRIRNEREKNG